MDGSSPGPSHSDLSEARFSLNARLFNAKRLGALFVLAAALLAAFLFKLVTSGRSDMSASDEAFHQGNLGVALNRAKSAGLAFVPGAEHVEAAEARIISIAKGAEASGDFELAFRAWDALRLIEQETSYFGRGDTSAKGLADEGLARLRKRRETLSEAEGRSGK